MNDDRLPWWKKAGWTMANAVTVTIAHTGPVEAYRFDFEARTVTRVDQTAGLPDMSPFLKARLDSGTKRPRLIGPQFDNFAGLTDSWESRPDAAAALLISMGVPVDSWTFDEDHAAPSGTLAA